MKMLVMLTDNYLRDYNAMDLKTFAEEGTTVIVFADIGHAEYFLDDYAIEYEEV